MGLSECREMCNLNSAQDKLKVGEQFWAAWLPHPYSNWEVVLWRKSEGSKHGVGVGMGRAAVRWQFWKKEQTIHKHGMSCGENKTKENKTVKSLGFFMKSKRELILSIVYFSFSERTALWGSVSCQSPCPDGDPMVPRAGVGLLGLPRIFSSQCGQASGNFCSGIAEQL